METLSDEIWDVVIAGTSLPQALLALSLSRSGLKILHVDRNDFYGGVDAGLSLEEAERWASQHENHDQVQSSAAVKRPDESPTALGPSRSYTLSLNPQIIYAQSAFLPSLVSSRIHTQLEFHAVGPWWIYKDEKLQKIPSNREDVFSDDTLSPRDKRDLMKFLRHVVGEQDESETSQANTISLGAALNDNFRLPVNLQPAILALSLGSQPVGDINFDHAVSRIRRHMRSIGYFGPGFGAVTAKYGSNAEIAQVACRACAVGGATYLLGHGLKSAQYQSSENESLVEVELTSGTIVKAKNLVGSDGDFPPAVESLLQKKSNPPLGHQTVHQIAIVSSSLKRLFPQPLENGSMPATVIVLVDDDRPNDPPLYLQAHSEDTGECPAGQCVVYGTTAYVDETSAPRLSSAIQKTVNSAEDDNDSIILWTLSYISSGTTVGNLLSDLLKSDQSGQIMCFPSKPYDIAFDDSILETVKLVWQNIMGSDSHDYEFMHFEEREGPGESD